MLFLILFSCLAIAFFHEVTTSVDVARNEEHVDRARLAAESGLQFIRYQLATLDIPPGTADANMAAEVMSDLQAKLDGSANLGTRKVGRSGNVITIPAITADNADGVASTFTGKLEWVPATLSPPAAAYLRATITGACGTVDALTRSVRLDYGVQGKPTTLFNYGIASKGAVTIKASVSTKVLGTPASNASILSAAAGATSITTGNGPVDGDLSVVVAKTQVALGGGSVGGATNSAVIKADHISVVPTPTFPVVDTSRFKALATNVYSASSSHQKNIRVPANTNPRFNGGDVVDGILYVESPNTVTFRGHATINGVIVFENKNDATQNVLDFKGNVSPANIPAGAEFDAVRAAAKGWAILAPAASVEMSGSVDGDVTGSVMAQQVAFSGSADLTVRHGSVISLGTAPTEIAGKTLRFVGTGADNPPTTGLTFNGAFAPAPFTYYEPR